MKIPRIVISGAGSGTGKTTLTFALALAFQSQGLRVQVFKCGPDYLDPGYHELASGRVCHNLDGWMMGEEAVRESFCRASSDADIAIIEGVMGLFDGASYEGEEGSTAQIAKWLKAPVLLTLDASGIARSIHAYAQGFRDFDPDIQLAGLFANRVGSQSHLDILKKTKTCPPVLGGFPKTNDFSFPRRHLGLWTACKEKISKELISHWKNLALAWVDLEHIFQIANDAENLNRPATAPSNSKEKKYRLGVAMDEAFHFYYEDNLARLEILGVELIEFSPLQDTELPRELDALYLGGGYPESKAKDLAENKTMKEQIQSFASQGGPIYAECGGLIYLSKGITTMEGLSFPMLGLIDTEIQMNDKLTALGYIEGKTNQKSLFGPPGMNFRGHQFRYSKLKSPPKNTASIYECTRRRNGEKFREGFSRKNILASYIHIHFASNPLLAQGFVQSMKTFHGKRKK